MVFTKETIYSLPEIPGVYLYYDDNGQIIYIGKAKNLKKRVSSYFQKAGESDIKTKLLVANIKTIEILQVHNEFEAQLLETKLIRKYLPKYNIISRDDRHYIYITLTKDEFPRFVFSRGRGNWGPFPSNKIARDLLKLIRSVIPFCTQNPDIKKRCFYSYIKLCNPCPVIIRTKKFKEYDELRKEYLNNIRRIKILLNGSVNRLVSLLTKEMAEYSRQKKFEQAAVNRDRINDLNYLITHYHEAQDYIDNPYLLNKDILEGLNSFEKLMKTYYPQILRINSIECYDISNTSGKLATGSMVTFTDGLPDKKNYRRFKIKNLDTPNDFGMLKEMLERRLKHIQWRLPDLFIVDGGKPQLAAFKKVLAISGTSVPVIGLAKQYEEIIIPGKETFRKIKLQRNSPALQLVQRIRDEAHRFAHNYHIFLRSKKMLQ